MTIIDKAAQILIKSADIFLHLDKYLGTVISSYGSQTYIILFAVIFLETGLVITPFLPGDSLLFAAGAFCGLGYLDFKITSLVIFSAAVIGDTVNYHIGKFLGPKVFHYENSRFFKKEYLDKTHAFYEKYGGKTIIIARFVPIVRTFAPFVAGIGAMTYSKFIIYNIFGAILWTFLLVSAGYFFGNIDFVKNNFSTVIIAIIFISILPGIIEYLKTHKTSEK